MQNDNTKLKILKKWNTKYKIPGSRDWDSSPIPGSGRGLWSHLNWLYLSTSWMDQLFKRVTIITIIIRDTTVAVSEIIILKCILSSKWLNTTKVISPQVFVLLKGRFQQLKLPVGESRPDFDDHNESSLMTPVLWQYEPHPEIHLSHSIRYSTMMLRSYIRFWWIISIVKVF